MNENGKNINEYKELHSVDENYGTTSISYLHEVCLIIDYLQPKSVLDYGCGKGTLLKALSQKYPNIKFYGYDPAILGKDILPEVSYVDLIINTDVLEHIPEDEIESVVAKIRSLSDKVYFNLHHALAAKILPDGTNAHCTVKNIYWYNNLLRKFFDDITILKGQEPWLTVVLTFPIGAEEWQKYSVIIKKKRMMRDVYLAIRPVYDKVRPLVYPLVGLVKRIVMGI